MTIQQNQTLQLANNFLNNMHTFPCTCFVTAHPVSCPSLHQIPGRRSTFSYLLHSPPSAGTESSRILIYSFLRKEPDDMLLLSDHRGRITHMTTALAALLGYDVPTMIAANATVGSLLPQPWAQLMFPQWLRDTMSSSGGGRSTGDGSGSTGATVQFLQLLAANKKLVSVRVCVTGLDDEDTPGMVIAVQKVSQEAGHDMRRLRLQVDSYGVVLSASESSGMVFGFSPTQLVGRSIASFIDVMRSAQPPAPPSIGRAAVPQFSVSRSSLASVFENADAPLQIGSPSGSTPQLSDGASMEEVSRSGWLLLSIRSEAYSCHYV